MRKIRRTFNPSLQIDYCDGSTMPLIGWHPPFTDVMVDGEKWKLAIGGGVMSINLTAPSGNAFSLSIEDIVEQMIKSIGRENW